MQEMLPRIYSRQLRDKLENFPAVALLGARQCGKTTLARRLGGAYFDMETEGDEVRLDAEWGSLAGGRKLVVVDEAQQAPRIFSRLRGTIDADRKRNRRFLLLGSVSPALMKNVSESLAGRLGLVRMTPFILPELKSGQVDDLWLRGGYPDGGILTPERFPDWQHDYLEAVVGRDLPTWGLPAKPRQTMRLLAMLAAVHGQPLNASQLGVSLALDHKTVVSYCDFLEGAFLIRRIQPYFTNIKKRLVKAPRVFWRDSGLLHALMNVTSLEQLYHQPWVGYSWEGFVIEQTIATLSATGQQPQSYFFRTSDDYELDLVLDWDNERWAIEIKLTSNPSASMIERLHKAADMIGASRRVLVCRIARKIEGERLLAINLAGWLRLFRGND
jgi:predicted AAA+ superfamily ATPase